MVFEIVGEIADVQIIAAVPGIRVLRYLRKAYGRGGWRKLKGTTIAGFETVRFIG